MSKFKVGDRVHVIKSSRGGEVYLVGSKGQYLVALDDDSDHYYEYAEYELDGMIEHDSPEEELQDELERATMLLADALNVIRSWGIAFDKHIDLDKSLEPFFKIGDFEGARGLVAEAFAAMRKSLEASADIEKRILEYFDLELPESK